MNVIIVTGRLGKDPETRATAAGDTVCNFSLAVNEPGAKEGAKPLWLSVVAWKKLGEICQKHLAKGRLIAVTGRLQVREFEGSRGKGTAIEIVAHNIEFLSSGEQRPGAQQAAPASAPATGSQVKPPYEPNDEDIPF